MRKRLLLPMFALIITLSPLAVLPDAFSVADVGQNKSGSTLFLGGLNNECADDQCG